MCNVLVPPPPPELPGLLSAKCLRENKQASKLMRYLGSGKRKETATGWNIKIRKITYLIYQVAFEMEATVLPS